jgi:hypothetical protein
MLKLRGNHRSSTLQGGFYGYFGMEKDGHVAVIT